MTTDFMEVTTMERWYANKYGWTDVHPFEVVRNVSKKCLEVREMNATLDPDWKPHIIPGGFSGHCTNQHEQRYQYAQKPDAEVIRIRLNKKGWQDRNGNVFKLSDKPYKFHDYNF